jgi:transposase-like protein
VVDGKHIAIKGVEYCEYLAIDTKAGLVHRYLRRGHECAYGYWRLFSMLYENGYEPWVVVSDGGPGIYSTLRRFGLFRHQRCHIHIMRDLRTGLRMHARQMKIVLRKYYLYKYAQLVLKSTTAEQREARLKQLQRVTTIMWPVSGFVEKNIIKAFIKTLPLAFTWLEYEDIWNIPKTSNLVEGYISRLNSRLKTMRGLKSSANAELVLNGIHHFLRKSN